MALLDRYVQVAALRTQALVAAILTSMFTLLDFVEELANVGQGHYRPIDALIYVSLTAPHRFLQVVPVSMLLGTLLALGNLNRTTELTAIRSVGISEARIVGSIVKLAVPIGVLLFLLAEFVIPPAQRLAQERRAAATMTVQAEQSFWAQGDGQYLNVQNFVGHSVLKDIDIFAFDNDGNLTSFIHGDRADLKPDGTWLLTGVVRKTVQDSLFHTEKLASLSWPSFITSRQIQLLRLPLDSMPPVELYRYVQSLKQRQQSVGRYEQELWAKISFPLSMVSMIMLTTPFVFGSSRARNAGYHIVTGAAVGIVFTLGQQIMRYVGDLLDMGPAISAMAPSLILMGLAFYLFRRTVA